MKKIYFLFLLLLFSWQITNAQWAGEQISQSEFEKVKEKTQNFSESFYKNVKKTNNSVHRANDLEVIIIDAKKTTRGNNINMYEITIKISWRFNWKEASIFWSSKNNFEGILCLLPDGDGSNSLFFIYTKDDDFSTQIDRIYDEVREEFGSLIDEICPDAKWLYY